jgi:hypothetical protein
VVAIVFWAAIDQPESFQHSELWARKSTSLLSQEPASGRRTPDRCDKRAIVTPPERAPFKPAPLGLSSNSLNFPAFNIRTKTGVVRLRRRK